jgi:hypothetical protein
MISPATSDHHVTFFRMIVQWGSRLPSLTIKPASLRFRSSFQTSIGCSHSLAIHHGFPVPTAHCLLVVNCHSGQYSFPGSAATQLFAWIARKLHRRFDIREKQIRPRDLQRRSSKHVRSGILQPRLVAFGRHTLRRRPYIRSLALAQLLRCFG